MKRPALLSVLIFIILVTLTLLMVYQQSLIIREDEDRELQTELTDIKERFGAVLNENISAATTLAIVYKQNGRIENFNVIAQELIQNHKYVDIIYLTDKFVVTQVYPLAGNEVALGRNVLSDSFMRIEASNALAKKELKFTGPYTMLNNRGVAIAGRVPIFINGEFEGFAIVISRLSTIKRFLDAIAGNNKKFVYRLSKRNPVTNTAEYFFQDHKIMGKHIKSAYIPEGAWQLDVAYAPDHKGSNIMAIISILGILLSFSVAIYVYSEATQRTNLEHTVALKTHQLGERIKELSTIYHLHNVLRDEEQSEDDVFRKLVSILPAGWQYVDVCEAKISFEGKDYITPGFVDSAYKQRQDFKLTDGRTGSIEIVYTREMPPEAEGPFLKEERDLINSISRSLEIYLNKVTQQKALADSEERFRSAFENAAIGMGILSLQGAWLRVNKSLCDMLGYSWEEMLKCTFQQITHPDDLERDLTFMQQSLERKMDVVHYEKRFIHKNGQTVWADLAGSLVRDKKEEPLFFISQIEDITERKKARRDLELALSLTRATIESTADGILVVDTSGRISDYNTQFLKLWRIPEKIIKTGDDSAVLAYGTEQLMHPEEFESKVKELYSNPELESRDILYFSDGRVFERYSKPQMNDNEIVGRVWSFRDVTQQKRLEAEIKQWNVDLEERVKQRTLEIDKLNEELRSNVQNLELANKALESFGYSISHDLRAPLRSINSFASLIEKKTTNLDADAQKFLKFIMDNAQKMNQLIEDLLAFSRLGKQELAKTNLDMNDLLHEVLDGINIHERNEHTELIAGDLLPANGDKNLLKQVFVNLISNALKYSSTKEKPIIQIGSYATESEHVYFVKDNGVGFNMKYYDKLFKVFQRVHNVKDFEGVGIGLAIVQHIVLKHGGRVWAEGEENVGATFYFTLPVSNSTVNEPIS